MALTTADVRKKFKGYRYQDMTTSDVYSLYNNFKSLKPQDSKPFVHSNGSRENCASVSGTIPVKIKGQQYNIPVRIWLRPTHPYVAPLVYVTPTQGMGIQQSQYVDTSGMVYLPYISEWKQGSSDLTTLVQIMCATFAEHCPVYSKQSRPPPAAGHAHNPYPAQPPPQGGAAYGQPGYPPRGGMPYPQQQPQHRPPYGQPSYAPYPAGPAGMPTPSPQTNYRPPPATGTQPYYPTSTAAPYPPTSSYHPHPQPPTSTSQPYYQPQVPTPSVVAATPVASSAAKAISAEDERKQIEEHERIKRQSLETAVEDKIRRQVKQVMDTAQEEMESMLQTQEELKQGSQKINSMLQDMENKKHEIDSSVDMLRSKNAELESMLDYLRAQPDKIDVDEAVTATTPLYNQILQLYAEENALDDTIYYLGEALRKGVIELEIFLKYIRELSRQQFMARATILKARSTAGLPDHGP